MKFEELSPELQAKVKAAKSPEEVMQIANEAGHELTDDELELISGGDMWTIAMNGQRDQETSQD